MHSLRMARKDFKRVAIEVARAYAAVLTVAKSETRLQITNIF